MSKKYLKAIFCPIMTVISYIYTPKAHRKLKKLINILHTYWVSKEYKKCDGIVEIGCHIIGSENISLGRGSILCRGGRIETFNKFNGEQYNPTIYIGENCRIGYNTHITCINKIVIGDNSNIGDRCLVTDNNHGNFSYKSYTFTNNPLIPDVFLLTEMERPLHSKGPVIIEHSCQIGEGSVILTGVTIGHNSIIASNSFVRENIPPYSIVAGNPAKVVRTFSNITDK